MLLDEEKIQVPVIETKNGQQSQVSEEAVVEEKTKDALQLKRRRTVATKSICKRVNMRVKKKKMKKKN